MKHIFFVFLALAIIIVGCDRPHSGGSVVGPVEGNERSGTLVPTVGIELMEIDERQGWRLFLIDGSFFDDLVVRVQLSYDSPFLETKTVLVVVPSGKRVSRLQYNEADLSALKVRIISLPREKEMHLMPERVVGTVESYIVPNGYPWYQYEVSQGTSFVTLSPNNR